MPQALTVPQVTLSWVTLSSSVPLSAGIADHTAVSRIVFLLFVAAPK